MILPFAPPLAQHALRARIRDIASEAHGKVSVACSLPGSQLDCALEPHAHPPMQSVFKLPLALAILHLVEEGKYRIDQPIRFTTADLILPKPYSPLQDKYPKAEVEIPLRTLLTLTVNLSDNTAADILLRLAGGPGPVQKYIAGLGVTGFRLRDGERELHRNVQAQYRNWFEPEGAVKLLRLIADRPPVNREHAELLLKWMHPKKPTNRLDADLPEGTGFAHKSGTSDVDNGLAHATNDIGLLTLPDGRKLAVAVFVTDSTADQPTREKVIAKIARTIYDEAVNSHP